MSRCLVVEVLTAGFFLVAPAQPSAMADPPAAAAPPVEASDKILPVPPERRHRGRVDVTWDSDTESLVRQALRSQVELQFPDNTLGEIASFLSQIHNIPVRFDVKAVGATGHSEESRVTANVSGVSLQQAIKATLPKELGVVVQSDGLVITSAKEADRTLYTRIYDIRPMVAIGRTPEELIRKVATAIDTKKIEGGSIVQKDSMLYVKQNQECQDIVLTLLNKETRAAFEAAPPAAPAK